MFYVLMMMLLPVFSFAQGFVIKGKVPGIISGYARIDAHKHEGEESHDELPEKVRIVNGEFVLKGKLAKPEMLDLCISTKKIRIFLENANYTVEEDFSKLGFQSLKGGVLHEGFSKFLGSQISDEAFIRKFPSEQFGAWLVKQNFTKNTTLMRDLFNVLTPAVQQSLIGKEVKEILDRLPAESK